jgi:MarR family transcriptional regulator, organic hydroperoxide resistance regulator
MNRRRRGVAADGTSESEIATGLSGPIDPVLEFIRLMWAVDHELQRVSKRMVGRMGLTAPQRLAVRFIGRHPAITFGALAELLHLHAGTVTGIVKRLEAAGLASRVRSTEDSRKVHLTLTPQGRAFDRRRRGTVEAAVRRMSGRLTSRQLAGASHVMRLLAEDLAAE